MRTKATAQQSKTKQNKDRINAAATALEKPPAPPPSEACLLFVFRVVCFVFAVLYCVLRLESCVPSWCLLFCFLLWLGILFVFLFLFVFFFEGFGSVTS